MTLGAGVMKMSKTAGLIALFGCGWLAACGGEAAGTAAPDASVEGSDLLRVRLWRMARDPVHAYAMSTRCS